MFFKKSPVQPCSPTLAHPEHYLQILAQNPGTLQELVLESIEVTGPFLNLEYSWQEDLSHSRADVVDTRLRAYIACAIFDACNASNVRCRQGLPHGIRPSWFLEGLPIPCSLVETSFSTDEKRMYQTIGPIMMSPALFSQKSEQIIQLAKGFRKNFSTVKV